MNYKPEDQAKLSCFYWTGYDPYLIWQPYKAEMLWHSPQIVQFYDVLNEKEMDAIVAMGRPQLKWATGKKFAEKANVSSRLSARAFFGNKIRELEGARLFFSGLIELLILDIISKI